MHVHRDKKGGVDNVTFSQFSLFWLSGGLQRDKELMANTLEEIVIDLFNTEA